MIKKIIIEVGGQKIELTPEQLDELEQDIRRLKPEPMVIPPVIVPDPKPATPWPWYTPPIICGDRTGDPLPHFPTTTCGTYNGTC